MIAATGSQGQLQDHSTTSQPKFSTGPAVDHELDTKSAEDSLNLSESALAPVCAALASPALASPAVAAASPAAASANVGKVSGTSADEVVHEGWLAATRDVSDLSE